MHILTIMPPTAYQGMSREQAREQVITDMQALGLIGKDRKNINSKYPPVIAQAQ